MNLPRGHRFGIERRIAEDAAPHGLIVMGALHPGRAQAKGPDSGTLVLLGAGPGFWPVYAASQEAADGAPDPVDRWSVRVIGALARDHAARALFPFGGPPYQPFIDWALKSGRAFPSPVGMLVHDTVGLMISYRGALHFETEWPIGAAAAPSPCETCADRPCTTGCPVGALSGHAPYDLALCHDFLDTGAGQDCLTHGCAARRACPVSAGAGRGQAQSAHHMKAFHDPWHEP
ncbi:ferredoxin [Pukyongiella litopenaei]|uniref:Ferredoxin n=1 Tax=Pukyongiella litopenaei TaxID=2605946 RepID=A0A2S0MQD0_9RHOB|nr:ferredoxin [Pukyongiella litopenaei]AVO38100.1 ferredoxin [Pukyongiella litopenaei]